MKELSQNALSWVVLVAGGAGYVALLAMSSAKAIAPLLTLGGVVLVLVYRNELSPKRRRLRRMQAGLCPLCGYDLKYHLTAGCPECGWERERGAGAQGQRGAGEA